MKRLVSARLALRPLEVSDWEAWHEARDRNASWLRPWEPLPQPGSVEVAKDRVAFRARCTAWSRQRHLDAAYAFGIFDDAGAFAGEIHLTNVMRGPFQSAMAGYWVDRARAGQGVASEALVLLLRFAFEDLHLHRVEICVVPRNAASRRVAEKVGLRDEGVAVGFLQICGVWEDHIRYAITADDWAAAGDDLVAGHLTAAPLPVVAGPGEGPPDPRRPARGVG